MIIKTAQTYTVESVNTATADRTSNSRSATGPAGIAWYRRDQNQRLLDGPPLRLNE